MPVHLCRVYGCFRSIMTVSSSCNSDYMAHKLTNIYSLPLYRRSLLTPGIGKWKELWPLEINWHNTNYGTILLMVRYQ